METIKNYKKEDFVKETGLTEKDVKELKEAYAKKYAIEKGWEFGNLSTDQLNEIYQQDGYKKAGLLLS